MNMRRRISAVATLFATSALVLTGCSNGGTDPGSGDGGDEQYDVGVVVLDLQDPDLAHMVEAMEGTAEEEGVTLQVTDSKKDVASELNQVEDLLTRQVDAVILQPLDGEASQNAANRVIEAGIPLFILSTEFAEGSDVEYESYIGVDDTLAGQMQAEYLNELMPDGGNVVFAAGIYGASWTDRRKSGFDETINDNFEIVAEFQAKGSRDEGKRNMEDTLQRFGAGEIDAVVANNDEMAIGAASAIKDAGRTGDIAAVVGVDGTPPAVSAIEAGDMTATVRQDSAGQGEEAVRVVHAFLKGDDIEDRYTLPFTLITEENVAEFAQ
ncbi:sugar ABC transporter substrate-binding protein [Leucobacter chromiiresistens]|uniref:Inositol transport system substrate-binding protein n=1 Tax=Leucobacter chromiiresistens TaxID=1079994 RepID=A0A1H0Y1R9_9MICO|nr:sugar ABC transporter substrate-binding protein [Leucobacter chromiiresistens]SDQ09035.1 inositol transport system substrate-binding protein [Leucobacter chromiiresistens]